MNTKICKISDIKSGFMKSFHIKDKSILIANVSGEFYCTDDLCTHSECSLGNEGFLDGAKIICGCHGATFDLADGKALTLPATVDLKTYPVSIEGGDLFIEIE